MYSLRQLLDLGFKFDVTYPCRSIDSPVQISILPGSLYYSLDSDLCREIKRWLRTFEATQFLFFELFTPLCVLAPVKSSSEVSASAPVAAEPVLVAVPVLALGSSSGVSLPPSSRLPAWRLARLHLPVSLALLGLAPRLGGFRRIRSPVRRAYLSRAGPCRVRSPGFALRA